MKDNIEKAIFIENTEPNEEDLALFRSAQRDDISSNERMFFARMERKELGEFAPSADLLLSEHDNEDLLYIVRYNFDEYRIGRGLVNQRTRESIYANSLAEALEADLYQLLDCHTTLLEWLRANDFNGIDYDGNYALR